MIARVSRLLPHTLLGRILTVLLLAILLAQGLSSALWYTELKSRQSVAVLSNAEQLAASMASTARYFSSLPADYRPIVLDQLRRMGGARFFISFNSDRVTLLQPQVTTLQAAVVQEVNSIIRRELGLGVDVSSQLSVARDLRVFSQGIPLMELPPGMGHYSLVQDPDKTPILAVQIQAADNSWLYMATVLPTPTGTLETETLSTERLLFLGLTVLLISIAAFLLVRSFLRPLTEITQAADELGRGNEHPPIAERGSLEMVNAARTFNAMRLRIERYIEDRNRFFSAISHDLKTPITRLRLRAELLESEATRKSFSQDIDELAELASSALHSIRDTTLDEHSTDIDIPAVMKRLAESAGLQGAEVSIAGECERPYRGKPIAIRRALGNLLDNAVFYGAPARGSIEITIIDSERKISIAIRDHGPGIPELAQQRVFEPYVRLEASRSRNTGGAGLGLSISRNIIRGHGGNLVLENHPDGGLIAKVTLPRH